MYERHRLSNFEVTLSKDHPGFADAAYRQRRDQIAKMAYAHKNHTDVAPIAYTDVEQDVWRTVSEALRHAHERYACKRYLTYKEELSLDETRIPQLHELNVTLKERTGFAMWPVAGLVAAKSFMAHLYERVFLSTQYMRHHSRPYYTPEPDVIHEIVGHAATLIDPEFCEVNRAFGRAAKEAEDEARVNALINVYWYAIEFGVVREQGELRALGAGLLSSVSELSNMHEVCLREFDIAEISKTSFDPTAQNPALFVGESVDSMFSQLLEWLNA